MKLLPEAEGELPDDDDDIELPEAVDVDPVVLALETEPDLENSHEMQSQAIRNTHVDSPDEVEAPELVVVTVAPTANGALDPTTELTSLCIEEINDDSCIKSFVCLLDLDSLEGICIAELNISSKIEEAQRTILRGHDWKSNGKLSGRGLNVIRESECVVKVTIDQLKGKGRGIATISRPSDRDRTPRRRILGGHPQVRQCRGQRKEKEDAGSKKVRMITVRAKKDNGYLRERAGCIRMY